MHLGGPQQLTLTKIINKFFILATKFTRIEEKKSPDSAVRTIVRDRSNEDDGDEPSDWRAP